MKDTKGKEYATRLTRLSGASWKKTLDVQRPYRKNIQKLQLGRTLEIGCGIGRLLENLPENSLGIDHNEHSINIAKSKGYSAVTTDEFKGNLREYTKVRFDSMLLAHVLEHMTTAEGTAIIKEYLPYIDGKVVVICPQEKGFKSDETHINFLKHADIETILRDCGLKIVKSYSFPFPASVGKIFTYNETIVVGQK